jgi:hypothetical protein
MFLPDFRARSMMEDFAEEVRESPEKPGQIPDGVYESRGSIKNFSG